jgi:hypothetical protein
MVPGGGRRAGHRFVSAPSRLVVSSSHRFTCFSIHLVVMVPQIKFSTIAFTRIVQNFPDQRWTTTLHRITALQSPFAFTFPAIVVRIQFLSA